MAGLRTYPEMPRHQVGLRIAGPQCRHRKPRPSAAACKVELGVHTRIAAREYRCFGAAGSASSECRRERSRDSPTVGLRSACRSLILIKK